MLQPAAAAARMKGNDASTRRARHQPTNQSTDRIARRHPFFSTFTAYEPHPPRSYSFEKCCNVALYAEKIFAFDTNPT